MNPSQDELDNIDAPAADHEWHDAPNFSRDNLKQQFREKVDRNKPVDRNDLRDVAGNMTQAADPNGSRDPRQTAQVAAQDQREGTNTGVDVATGLRQGINDLQRRVDENTSEDQKQRGREYRDRTKNYFQEKMPKDRREQTIWRLKKMVVEIQSHQDYTEAINTLLHLAETYTGHGKNTTSQSVGGVKTARQDTNLHKAEHYLKVLVERFANNTSTDDLMGAINDIYRDADNDPELKNWFRSVNRYIRRCLQEEGYIMQPNSTREYNQLYEQGNYLLRNRYRDHTDRIVDEFRFMCDQFAVDSDNNRFAQALQKLFNDLGNDENGKPTFKKHLIKDVTQVVLPDIFESVRYVPMPRIEYSDRSLDAVVENLVLESDNLMPNVLEIGYDSHFRFGRKTEHSKRKQTVMVSASQIQCDLRDISYYVKRKQGFPSITDTGVCDVFLGGQGFSFKLQLSTANKHDRARFFKVDDAKVTVSHLNIKLKQSKHKALFSLLKPLLLKVLKPVIIKVLEKQIRQTFSDFDAFCYRVHQEEQKVEAELKANPDPENVHNIYARYYQAFQKEIIARKKKAEAKVADKHAKMAVTTEDSMFKDIKLPGGISTRASEYKNQARGGDRWQNDIFSIGSASLTTGIPKPPQATRKSPHAHRRTVKGTSSRDSGYDGVTGNGAGPFGNTHHTTGAYGSGVPPVTLNNPVHTNKAANETYDRHTQPAPYPV